MRRSGLPLLFILGGSVLILSAAVFALSTSFFEQPAGAPLPEQLGGLPLVSHSAGKAAALEIARLHRQEFFLSSAAVGVYGANQTILWIAGTPAGFLTGRMVTDMEDKIASVPTPFSPTGQIQHGQRTVYELTGMGQKHYYFQSKNLLVWLAADEELAEQALTQTLEYYP
jgi:hypothetical protein